MKKKILAFFFALHIFCFSLVYCFCCPVYAVGEEVLLFEGFQSLMFMLGLSADLSSGMTQSQWVTKVDSDFSNAIAQKSQEQQDILYDNYAAFKDNLEHGYMIISDTLFDFFKDTAYEKITEIENISTVPSSLQDLIGRHYGHYIYLQNVYLDYSGSTRCDMLLYYYGVPNSNFKCENFTVLGTPLFYKNWSYYSAEYSIATFSGGSYGYKAYVNKSNNVLTAPATDYTFTASDSVSMYCDQNLTLDSAKSRYVDLGYYNSAYSQTYDNLVSQISKGTYEDIIDDTFVNTDGYITTTDGVLPQVLDDTTIGDLVDDIKTGQKSWASSIGSITDSYPENPAMPEDTLTLPELDQLIADLHLERLQSKFPFCIPHDIQLIYSGATAVSANAPVLVIPIDITFQEHTYFHDDEFITIDFSMFDSIIPIFREGFFLLFLVGLLWVSIHILQAFFVVTE